MTPTSTIRIEITAAKRGRSIKKCPNRMLVRRGDQIVTRIFDLAVLRRHRFVKLHTLQTVDDHAILWLYSILYNSQRVTYPAPEPDLTALGDVVLVNHVNKALG